MATLDQPLDHGSLRNFGASPTRDQQCRLCGAWGSSHDEFLGTLSGLCANCDPNSSTNRLKRQTRDAAHACVVIPASDPFASPGWPPADLVDQPVDAQGCASPSPADGAAAADGSRGGEGQTSPGRDAVSRRAPTSASAPAKAGADVCGRPHGLPVAGASDIASARYPDCGGDVTRFLNAWLASLGRREGSRS